MGEPLPLPFVIGVEAVALATGVVEAKQQYDDVREFASDVYEVGAGLLTTPTRKRKRGSKRTVPRRERKARKHEKKIRKAHRKAEKAARKVQKQLKFVVPAMPKHYRRKAPRRSRRKSVYARKRRTRRKVARKRRKSRRHKYLMSTRAIPLTKKMQFSVTAQHTFESRPGGWGVITFPVNTMERPFGCLDPSDAENYQLEVHTEGADLRQPAGYDRWLAPSFNRVAGMYTGYTVEECKIEMTHLPAQLSDQGKTLLIASMDMPLMEWTGNPQAFGNESLQFANMPLTDLQGFWERGSVFKNRKMFQNGSLGQKFTYTYKKNKWNKKYPQDERQYHPHHDLWGHNGVSLGDSLVSNKLKLAGFAVGQLGVTVDSPARLSFLIKITYKVILSGGLGYALSVDSTEAVGQFQSAQVNVDGEEPMALDST